jgi:catechol 2,3-dioxygenase-like lactoylglutathione lyase family enzyme
MKLELDHVALRCTDIEKVKSFFTEILGLTVGYRPPFPFPGFWLYAERKCMLHLFSRNAHFYGNETASQELVSSESNIVDHIALWSDDYNSIMAKIKKNNLNFSESNIPELNTRQVFIQAPENLIVELNFTT